MDANTSRHSPGTQAPVVAGIDGSASAVRAAVWAADRALARSAPLRLLRAIPDIETFSAMAGLAVLTRERNSPRIGG